VRPSSDAGMEKKKKKKIKQKGGEMLCKGVLVQE
jgi:hypothetical protein